MHPRLTPVGKCVPFDWVSFAALLLYKRFPSLYKIEKRHLYVGIKDASVLVLDDPSPMRPKTAIMKANLEGTKLWGVVDSIIAVDRVAMLQIARSLTSAQTGST